MKIPLKAPKAIMDADLRTLLEKRYSCRQFSNKKIPIDTLASILWASCGKKFDALTGASRTIPSAGATYPLELYVVVGENAVDTLNAGVYLYLINEHSLQLIVKEDRRVVLEKSCLGQSFIAQAPVSLVIAAQFSRTTARYGERGEQYVYMEAGHASQNAYLLATSFGLGTVEVGAFVDEKVAEALDLPKEQIPLIVMPIGYSK